MEHDLQRNRPGDAMPDYREAIDACRPDRFDPAGSDWKLPELASVADEVSRNPKWRRWRSRVAELDTAISAAIEQTPVPQGLADRLLDRLRETAAEKSAGPPLYAGPTGAEEESVLNLPAAGRRQERRFAGRRWWLGGAVAAAAAALVAFGWWWTRPAGSLDYDQLLAEVIAFDQAWEAGAWKSASKSPPRAWYAIPYCVSSRAATRWQAVERFAGRSGVVYDLRGPAGANGALYVVPLSTVGVKAISGLGSAPGKPHHTAGRAVSAWTDGVRMFVLVIRGGERDYWSVIVPPGVA